MFGAVLWEPLDISLTINTTVVIRSDGLLMLRLESFSLINLLPAVPKKMLMAVDVGIVIPLLDQRQEILNDWVPISIHDTVGWVVHYTGLPLDFLVPVLLF